VALVSTDIDFWALAAAAPAKRAAAEAEARRAVAEAEAIAAKKAVDEKDVALSSLSTKFGAHHLALESILSTFNTEFLLSPNSDY
jgi:regulator of protease activity HflC (stomatin/prohibitin superfamily)